MRSAVELALLAKRVEQEGVRYIMIEWGDQEMPGMADAGFVGEMDLVFAALGDELRLVPDPPGSIKEAVLHYCDTH